MKKIKEFHIPLIYEEDENGVEEIDWVLLKQDIEDELKKKINFSDEISFDNENKEYYSISKNKYRLYIDLNDNCAILKN